MWGNPSPIRNLIKTKKVRKQLVVGQKSEYVPQTIAYSKPQPKTERPGLLSPFYIKPPTERKKIDLGNQTGYSAVRQVPYSGQPQRLPLAISIVREFKREQKLLDQDRRAKNREAGLQNRQKLRAAAARGEITSVSDTPVPPPPPDIERADLLSAPVPPPSSDIPARPASILPTPADLPTFRRPPPRDIPARPASILPQPIPEGWSPDSSSSDNIPWGLPVPAQFEAPPTPRGVPFLSEPYSALSATTPAESERATATRIPPPQVQIATASVIPAPEPLRPAAVLQETPDDDDIFAAFNRELEESRASEIKREEDKLEDWAQFAAEGDLRPAFRDLLTPASMWGTAKDKARTLASLTGIKFNDAQKLIRQARSNLLDPTIVRERMRQTGDVLTADEAGAINLFMSEEAKSKKSRIATEQRQSRGGSFCIRNNKPNSGGRSLRGRT